MSENFETHNCFSIQNRVLPKWLVMTLKSFPAKLKTVNKNRFSIEEVVKSLRSVGDDVEQIFKLSSEEKKLVAEFLEVLALVPQQMFSITVSTSNLPFRAGAVQQAHIDQNGNLILTTMRAHHSRFLSFSVPPIQTAC